MRINPTAVAIVALATVIGALAGAPLVGLAIGLAIIIIADLFGV